MFAWVLLLNAASGTLLPEWVSRNCPNGSWVRLFLWGITIVADSAQFSAAISELSPPEYVGTALTMQTSMGFLLTIGSIQLVPIVVDAFGWSGAFLLLAAGPVVGIVAMLSLRRLPESLALAGGKR